MRTASFLLLSTFSGVVVFAHNIAIPLPRDSNLEKLVHEKSYLGQARLGYSSDGKVRLERRGSFPRQQAQQHSSERAGSQNTLVAQHPQALPERSSFQPLTEAVRRLSQQQRNQRPQASAPQRPIQPDERPRQISPAQPAAGPMQPMTQAVQRMHLASLPVSFASGRHSRQPSSGQATSDSHDTLPPLRLNMSPGSPRSQNPSRSNSGTDLRQWADPVPWRMRDPDSPRREMLQWRRPPLERQGSVRRLVISPTRSLASGDLRNLHGTYNGYSSSSVTSISSGELAPLLDHERASYYNVD